MAKKTAASQSQLDANARYKYKKSAINVLLTEEQRASFDNAKAIFDSQNGTKSSYAQFIATLCANYPPIRE